MKKDLNNFLLFLLLKKDHYNFFFIYIPRSESVFPTFTGRWMSEGILIACVTNTIFILSRNTILHLTLHMKANSFTWKIIWKKLYLTMKKMFWNIFQPVYSIHTTQYIIIATVKLIKKKKQLLNWNLAFL